MVNMAIPFYQGISLPFVASIVIGAIQLGATVDYAILMTTRYQKERQRDVDHARKEASQRGVHFAAGHHVAHRPADPADDPAADGQQNQRDENAQAEVDDVFDQHADQVLGRHVRQHVEFLLDNGFFRCVRDGLGRGDQL